MSHADMISLSASSVGRKCLHWALSSSQKAVHAVVQQSPSLSLNPIVKGRLQNMSCKVSKSASDHLLACKSAVPTKLQLSCLEKQGFSSQAHLERHSSFSSASRSGKQSTHPFRCQGGASPAQLRECQSPETAHQSRCFSSDSASTSSSSEGGSPDSLSENGVRVAVGSIHIIMGPMFAGKTTALLARMQDAVLRGQKIALVKSGIDVRYGLTDVVSHDGTRMPCLAVNTLQEFRSTIGEAEYDELDVIGIDEAQFFSDLDAFCRQAADRDHKEVVVAGLDGDFKRRKFGQLLDLVPTADSIVKLSATCELCKQPASFTLRTTEETETQVVGGADKYMPVCRKHWVEGNYAIKMARTFLRRSTSVEPAPAAK